MSDSPLHDVRQITVTRHWALGIGLLATVGSVWAGSSFPAPFFRAYLAAYMFFLGAALGSLALLMLYHLTGGAWAYLIRPILEAQTRTLPLLALLFLPIGFAAHYLYEWPEAGTASLQEPGYEVGRLYLNMPFFWLRAVVYFVLWIGLTGWLNRITRHQMNDGSPRWTCRARNVASIGALLFGISIHFSTVDWLLMLDEHFHSTIYPPLVAVSQLTTALALAIIALRRSAHLEPLSEVISRKALVDQGSLLMSFVILCAYMNWFQYLLIWMPNLPHNAQWFAKRMTAGWIAVIWVLFLGGFVIPLFLLLQRAIKTRLSRLAATAWLIVAMQLLFPYYLVLPGHAKETLATHWIDPLPLLAIGGIWLTMFLFEWQRGPLLVSNGYNRAQALKLRQLDEEEDRREEALSHG